MRALLPLLLFMVFCIPVVTGANPIQPPKPEDITFIVGIFNTNFCVIYKVVISIAGALAAMLFVWCGLKWISSQDDPAERQRARDTIAYILLGLILILVSKPVAEAVLGQTFNC